MVFFRLNCLLVHAHATPFNCSAFNVRKEARNAKTFKCTLASRLHWHFTRSTHQTFIFLVIFHRISETIYIYREQVNLASGHKLSGTHLFEWNAIKPAPIRNRTQSQLIVSTRMVVYTVAESPKVYNLVGLVSENLRDKIFWIDAVLGFLVAVIWAFNDLNGGEFFPVW